MSASGLRMLAHPCLHALHERQCRLPQPQRVGRVRREFPQAHANADARVIVALQQPASTSSLTMRCAVEVGSPARHPFSAAVCIVRAGVHVSSTRINRSVTESPEEEFALWRVRHG